jgi:hypothetical protein
MVHIIGAAWQVSALARVEAEDWPMGFLPMGCLHAPSRHTAAVSYAPVIAPARGIR